MSNIVISIGALILALGGYAYTASVSRSAMTLIPALFGVILVALGVLSMKESLRKHAMHAAAAIALLGIVAGIGPLAMGGTKRFPPVMIQSTTGLMVLCGVLLALAVRSFIQARRART